MPSLKYNSKYHDDWGWSLAVKGATNGEIAEAFGISERTFNRWCKKFSSLNIAVQEGKTIANAKVIRSLYERAIGITTEDTEKSVILDEHGNPKPIKVRTYKKEYPPDTMAIMYWLNNRERDSWRQRQEITGANGTPLVPSGEVVRLELPDNGRDKS